MRPHQKASSAIRIIEVGSECGEGVVHLIVGLPNTVRAVAHSEVHEYRRHVVGQRAVLFAEPLQRMPHDDVREQRKGRAPALSRAQQGVRQSCIVEHIVDSVIGEPSLDDTQLRAGVARDETSDELRIVTREMTPRVRENHVSLL